MYLCRSLVLSLLAFLFCSAHAFLVADEYSLSSCTGSSPGRHVFSGACMELDDTFTRYVCSGDNLIVQNCTDSACTDCTWGTAATYNMNQCNYYLGTYYQFSCPSSFPSFSSQSVVTETFTSSTCLGEPFAWHTSSGTNCNGQNPDCSVENGIGGTSQETQCGKDVQIPSGDGNPVPNCTVTGACDFWLNCVEATKPCAATDYAIAFGMRTCTLYKNGIFDLSPAGQQWVHTVLTCLQTQMSQSLTQNPDPTCQDIRTDAYAAHDTCFDLLVKHNSTCFSEEDFGKIMRIVWSALVYIPGALEKIVQHPCFASYGVTAVWKIFDISSEGASDLISAMAEALNISESRISIVDSNDASILWPYSSNSLRSELVSPRILRNASVMAAPTLPEEFVWNRLSNQSGWSNIAIRVCNLTDAGDCASGNTVSIYGAEPNTTSTTTSSANTIKGIPAVLFLLYLFFAVLNFFKYLK